ncbi:rhomboid-domain-containing protein [Hesseltinella vesiculosa]|uniref:Rhomboid-type serine protease n=1 Tax=Hesseltinella vesiculosa TaxID=101127 RepID=A0A1X2GVN1_9FUNG|nr:rhomboid-domain-containing protein [Hesseltinella vesiculosa]
MQHPPAEKGQRIPLFSYIFALMAGILLIYGFIQFKNEYSAVLSLSPFNIYLGVNAQTLVRTGALFPPCMRASLELTPSQSYPCANASNWVYEIPMTGGGTCQLENVCGLTPFKSAQAPDQAFRFLTALLTSGGVFQYVINMLFLLSYGAMVERQMGTLRYIYIFIVSGTFGYCFGSVFIHDNVALMGCLVPIFGLAGASLMDGFRSWQSTLYPGSPILRFLLVIVLGVIVGYLPGYNNFCHLGGLMGGILAQWSIWSSQAKFLEQRVRWLMMMAFRLIALVALIVLFYEVLSNFYTNHSWSQGCNWCQFVSCLPFYNTCSSL